MKRNRKLFTVLMALMFLLVACAGGEEPGTSTDESPDGEPTSDTSAEGDVVGDEIVLGMFAPLTGPLAATGVPARDGVQTWVDEMNAAGGIHGRQLRLVAYDDANNPQEAAAAVRRLIDQDQAFALVCGSSSGSSLAVLELVHEAGIPFVTCISAHRDLLAEPNETVYRIYANEVAQAEAVADYVADDLGAKKPAIIYNTNDFGIGGYEVMTERLRSEHDLEFVAAPTHNPGDQDFSSQLLQIRQSGADALIVHAFAADAGIIVRQAVNLGLDMPMVGGGGTPTPLFPQAAGEAGKGFVANWVFPVLPTPEFPAVAAYIDKLTEHVHPNGLPQGRPSLYDLTGYIAGQVVGEALDQAGEDLTRQSFLDALDSLDGFDPAGVGFPITFADGNKEGTDEVVLVRINDELEWELFEP